MVNKSVFSSKVIVSVSVSRGRSVVEFQHLSRVVVLREILYEPWLVDQLSPVYSKFMHLCADMVRL